MSPCNAGHGGPGPLCLSQLETRLGHAGDTCLLGGRLPFCTPPLRPQALPGVHTMSLTSFPEGGRPAPRTGTLMTAHQSSQKYHRLLPRRWQRCSLLPVLQVRGGRQAGPPDTQPDHAGPLADSGTDSAALPPSPAWAPALRGIRVTVKVVLGPSIAAGVRGCESKCTQVGVAHGPRGSHGGTPTFPLGHL